MAESAFDFFNPDRAKGPDDTPDVGRDVTDDILGRRDDVHTPWSVSKLVRRIRSALSEAFPQQISVVGELSGVKRHGSGHLYFRIKDGNAAIDAVMFRGSARHLKFTPADGLEVVIDGRVDVYEVRGQLQLYAERMTPRGAGALELAFRQMREKLQAEGLFDPQHKKPIPRYPRALGVITSPTGAALRDIRRTLARRWPAGQVYLLGVLVQGDAAAGQIARAVELLDANAVRLEIDTLILSRGGGSMEDLWAFNEEVVARAVFAARTPVICGVGHEVDISIADLVADLRAPTPTAAAELAVPDVEEVRRSIHQCAMRLRRRLRDRLKQSRAELNAVERSVVFRDPSHRLRTLTQKVDELEHRELGAVRHRLATERSRLAPAARRLAALHPQRLRDRAAARVDRLAARLRWSFGSRSKRAGDATSRLEARLLAASPRHGLRLARQRVDALSKHLEALSHRSVLKRGFSVTSDGRGRILRSIEGIRTGQTVQTELADGRFKSVVDGNTTERPSRRRARRKKASDDSQPWLFSQEKDETKDHADGENREDRA